MKIKKSFEGWHTISHKRKEPFEGNWEDEKFWRLVCEEL